MSKTADPQLVKDFIEALGFDYKQVHRVVIEPNKIKVSGAIFKNGAPVVLEGCIALFEDEVEMKEGPS